MQCRLHICDLGLFNTCKKFTILWLNSVGLKLFQSLLNSNLISEIDASHRVRDCWKEKSKLNGDDVSLIIPYFDIIMTFIER